MVSLDDAARMASELPEVAEGERHGHRSWSVAGKTFAWERSFSRADLRRFGDVTPPDGPILAVRVEDRGEKEAVLAAQPKAFFTIPHFNGYAAVLIRCARSPSERCEARSPTAGWPALRPPSSSITADDAA